MAYTPVNYLYENVLKKFQEILRTEYNGSLPVYIGEEYKKQRNSHIRMFVNNVTNIDSKEKSIVNLVNIDFVLYLNIRADDMQAKKKVLDMSNRLEQVLFENKLDSNDLYFDGIVEEAIFDSKEDVEVFVDNLRVSRINYSVKIPLKYQTYGFFLESDGDRYLTSSSKNILVLN